ncbi:MAG TPA: DegT/DnrJ/EryC1/StrS family aminotransferase [Candidatus Limnocylindria bacterium]|nr:DegT/DnrJ/EryC1/StrS family aminotransferase [Candidatus Limnocylindria bacterium]
MRHAAKQIEAPVRDRFLVFGSPLIGEAEIAEVVATLRSGWIGTGPRVAKFEEMMKAYAGAKHAIAVSSCTAALHLSLLALGIGSGDEVITTPMTFVATANAIAHAGAKPVFADVSRETMLIEPKMIERAITRRTKAVIPVHLAGRVCPMNEIMPLARARGLHVIEDAAHCIEGRYQGQHVGIIGDLTCFSFYATKNLTTGEGGMVMTENPEWASRIRTLSLHGMDKDAYRRFSDTGYKHYQVVEPGYKYNMTDIQAALGIHQLKRIEASWKRRNEIWNYFQEHLSGLPIHLPAPDESDTRHARHLFTIQVHEEECGRTRDQVLDSLTQQKIGCGVHYTPVHLHPYYRKTFGFSEGDFPNAEWIGDGTVSLPLSAKLTDDDVEDVVAAVRHALEE